MINGASEKFDFSSDNIYESFATHAVRYDESIALVSNGGKGKSYSYGDLLSEVNRLVAGLQDKRFSGISAIGILSENRPEWAITYLAILGAGKTVIPIDANLSGDEIKKLIHTADIKLLFLSAKFASLMQDESERVMIYCFDKDHGEHFGKLMNSGDIVETAQVPATASLIHTSGTTGNPKVVVLTHRNILSNISGAGDALKFTSDDVFLSLLPLHHTFESTCGFLLPLMTGCKIVYARSLKSRDIVEDIALNNVTIMCGVPLLYEKIYQGIIKAVKSSGKIRSAMFAVLLFVSSVGWKLGMPFGKTLFSGLRKKTRMSSIRMFVSGGAALPFEIGRFFNLVGFSLIQGYGMTECSPIICAQRPGKLRFGSVGTPLPNVEISISNINNEGIGEIIVRGENVTPGYKNNPAATSELIKDGWLYTGDLGKIKNGHLWITGRAKNLIVSASGKNIYPEELEEKLNGCWAILETVVFGRAKADRQGEEVRAILVPDLEMLGISADSAGSPEAKKIISEHLNRAVSSVNSSVASYKRIANYDIRLKELEKTSTKKVRRNLYK